MSKLLRTIGRFLLWGAVLLVVVRGVGAILSGEPESSTRAQAGARVATQVFPNDEARAFAVQFARAYLTFTPEHPGYHELAVRPYLARDLREDAALEFPDRGPSQTVTSATIARAKPLGGGRALVTVAATVLNDTVTTRYLTVPVARDNAGGLVVYDYPAFSSPPAPGDVTTTADPGSLEGPGAGEIEDLLRRFLTAYLDAQPLNQLSYFLARDARVTALAQRYRLREVVGLAQLGDTTGPQRTVLATVRVKDPATRATYTLRYRIEVTRRDRWYVQAIAGGAN